VLLTHKYKIMENKNSVNTAGTSEKIWFITGASRGFGRVWAEAALNRDDKVAATARTLSSMAELKEKYGQNVLTLEMDFQKFTGHLHGFPAHCTHPKKTVGVFKIPISSFHTCCLKFVVCSLIDNFRRQIDKGCKNSPDLYT